MCDTQKTGCLCNGKTEMERIECEQGGELCLHHAAGGTPESMCGACDGFNGWTEGREPGDHEAAIETEIDRTRLGGMRNCGTCLDTDCLNLDHPSKRRACTIAYYSDWKPNKRAQAFIALACNSHRALMDLAHLVRGLANVSPAVTEAALAAIAKATPE